MHRGLYEFRVISFGQCDAPATCERLIKKVLSTLHRMHCMMCIDDVISFGSNFELAVFNFCEVLSRINHYGLQVNFQSVTVEFSIEFSKCHIFLKEVR